MKKRIIEKYKKRNDKLFHLFDHLTLHGTKRIIKIFIVLQFIMMLSFLFWETNYLSVTGGLLSLLLTLYYYFKVNETNRRSAIYKLFAWILILPSAFDLGGDMIAASLEWEDMALNVLFVISGVTMYWEFLKVRQPQEGLLLL